MTKNKWLKLDLQTFADDTPPPVDETPPTDDTPETFTKSEVDSQISKSVENALKKRQAEWDAQLDEKLKAERKSAEEYAKLTAKEKEDADYNNRLSDLEKREQELNNRQLLSQVEADLKEIGLPVTLAPALITAGDNEQIKEAINGIKKDFDEAVNSAVKEALRQETPKLGGGIGDTNKAPNIAEMARAARIIK